MPHEYEKITKLFLARRVLRGAISPFLLDRPCAAWTLLADVEVPCSANASRNHVLCDEARHVIAAQHSVQLTVGGPRVFPAFFVALSLFRFDRESTPSPTALTRAVGRVINKDNANHGIET